MKTIITKQFIFNTNLAANRKALQTQLNTISWLRVARITPEFYREVTIPKKDGTTRTLLVPTADLKVIQREILDLITGMVVLPECVYGFSKDKTIITNASCHASQPFALALDIKDFFSSVHFERIKQLYRDLGFDESETRTLCHLTTLKYALPQGAPTSPFLASLALLNFDYRGQRFAQSNNFFYTRYFDDLVLSGPADVSPSESEVCSILSEEGYQPNSNKREVYRAGDIKLVTGINIDTNGNLFLKSTEDLISYLEDLTKFGLSSLKTDNYEKERSSLGGKVSFLLQVDRTLGPRAQQLYGSIRW
jgi:RNA-directed DNA polymerase